MLKNFWYALAFSSEVTATPSQHRVLAQDVGLQRHPDGRLTALRGGDSFPVQEKYRFVWVFLGDLPEADRPPLPDWDLHFNDTSLGAVQGKFLWKANYARVLENGVDIAHTPWVHGDDFGNRELPVVPDYVPTLPAGYVGSSCRTPPSSRRSDRSCCRSISPASCTWRVTPWGWRSGSGARS